MAFWFANACYADNLRESYIYALKKFIEVDDFGDCYDKICARGDPAECFFNQASNYWFYLAFEDNNCPGYISEYFWKSLNLPIIPVVMGGSGNFSRYQFFCNIYYISKFCLLGYIEQAPEHSFIDVNNYKSVNELANYLKYLTNHTVSFVNKVICYVTKYILKKNHYVGRI